MTLATDIRQGVLRLLETFEPPPAPSAPLVDAELARFKRLMLDYPRRPGKTLRGRLLVLAARAHGASDSGGATILAEALELFQNWVLVHDDIEDGSEERRGLPALHREVGVPVALNVGDAMHMLMWRHLLTLPAGPPLAREAALDEFGRMLLATTAGQHLDLAWVAAGRFDVTEAEYTRMVTLKTAFYTVVTPLRLGALCAGTTPPAEVEAAATDLGVAFQIRDDVLNLTAGADHGKEPAGDLYEGKRTLILARLLATLPDAERAGVIAALDRPREEKSGEAIRGVLQLMLASGAVDHAQGVADRAAASGLAVVREWLGGLPDRAAADAVAGLLADLAGRPA